MQAMDGGPAAPAAPAATTSTRASSAPAKAPTYTELEKQIIALKNERPDCLLMVENGYKLCWYGEDAVAAGDVLGFRPRVWNNFMATWGPTRRVYAYLVKLLAAGYKVGLVRQTETAALRKAGEDGSGGRSGKMFARGIVAVYTPGTILDEDDPCFADLLLRKKAVGGAGAGADGKGGFSFGGGGGDDDGGDEDDDDGLAADDVDDGGDDGDGAAAAAEADEDRWIAAVDVHAGSGRVSVVAVNVLAHSVRCEVVERGAGAGEGSDGRYALTEFDFHRPLRPTGRPTPTPPSSFSPLPPPLGPVGQ